jgi:YHS domain-containing protein
LSAFSEVMTSAKCMPIVCLILIVLITDVELKKCRKKECKKDKPPKVPVDPFCSMSVDCNNAANRKIIDGTEYRMSSGQCNNLDNFSWGNAGVQHIRVVTNAYANGMYHFVFVSLIILYLLNLWYDFASLWIWNSSFENLGISISKYKNKWACQVILHGLAKFWWHFLSACHFRLKCMFIGFCKLLFSFLLFHFSFCTYLKIYVLHGIRHQMIKIFTVIL